MTGDVNGSSIERGALVELLATGPFDERAGERWYVVDHESVRVTLSRRPDAETGTFMRSGHTLRVVTA